MAIARELSIVYGSLTVGGASTANLLTGKYLISQEPELTRVEFEFMVVGSTEAAFKTAVAAAESEFNTPWQNLTITLGAQTLLSLTQTGNEGFDARPRLEKLGGDEDTGRSRKYRAVIEFGRPASYGSPSGLRESAVQIDYTPSRRRTIRISGTFTAVGANDARAQYDAQISTFQSSVTSAYGDSLTYELVNETTTHDTNDKLLRFERELQEVVFGQGASAGTDDSAIVRQSLQIARNEQNPGFSPIAHPLVQLTARYDAWIDKTVTTDLTAKWDSLRSWIFEQIENTLGGSSIILVREEPQYDYDENRITATVEAMGRSSLEGTDVLARELTTEDREIVGEVLAPIWTGNPYHRYRYQGPAQLRRTIRETITIIGSQPEPSLSLAARSSGGGGGGGGNIPVGVLPPDSRTLLNIGGNGVRFTFPGTDGNPDAGLGGGGAGAGGGGGGARNWVLIEQSEATTPRRLGFNGKTLDVTDLVRVSVYEHYEEPPSSGGGYGNTP